MKAHLVLIGLFLPLFSVPAISADSKQCPVVNCDCGAISDAQWRSHCVSREKKVIEDCIANQGNPKSYCGLHGPAAFPVATSLQPDKKSLVIEDNDPAIIEKLIATQNWSLDESFNILKSRESAKQYGDAVKMAGLLERDLERLYQLHRQADAVYKQQERDDVSKVTDAFALAMTDRAKALREYAAKLWQSAASADSDKNQKAQRVLAFRVSRLAATVYEYSGELYSLAGSSIRSAELWQAAAEVSQILRHWEQETENKLQHVTFYQAQAASRLHRATYHLIEAGQDDSVVITAQRAQALEGTLADIADTSHANHESAEDMRAIKRGSR